MNSSSRILQGGRMLPAAATALVAITLLVLMTLPARRDPRQNSRGAFDRISLVQRIDSGAQGVRLINHTRFPLLSEVKSMFPGLQDGARFWEGMRWVEADNKVFREPVAYADPSLFCILRSPLVRDTGTARFENGRSVVITRQVARRYFGSDDPVGKTLTIDFQERYTVAGVLTDLPQDSLLKLNIIAPIADAVGCQDAAARSGT